MVTKNKKRFIAGASCPQCSEMDSLRWWIENNIEHVECVNCGFYEQRVPKRSGSSRSHEEQMIGIFKPE